MDRSASDIAGNKNATMGQKKSVKRSDKTLRYGIRNPSLTKMNIQPEYSCK